MENSKDHKAAAEPPLDCRVGRGIEQDWAGMNGVEAFMLIQRHADNWDDVLEMMHAWLRANGGTVPNAN